jgi:hypothetical protein
MDEYIKVKGLSNKELRSFFKTVSLTDVETHKETEEHTPGKLGELALASLIIGSVSITAISALAFWMVNHLAGRGNAVELEIKTPFGFCKIKVTPQNKTKEEVEKEIKTQIESSKTE